MRVWVNPHCADGPHGPETLYLWYAVLRTLGHWVGHGQMVNHHDVLIGLIDCSGCLRTGSNRRTAVRDGSSRRLYLRPLEKLGKEKKKIYLFLQRGINKFYNLELSRFQ